MDAEDFTWSFLTADGLTDFGEACKQLNEKLSRKAFMGDVAGSFAPAIFLLSDGEPTDEYASSLAKLKENNWFKKAIKVAVAIGEDANRDVLAEFTGNKEAVLTVHTPERSPKCSFRFGLLHPKSDQRPRGSAKAAWTRLQTSRMR